MNLLEMNHYGKLIPKESIFFKIPETISEIISASSTYFEGRKPLTSKEKIRPYFVFIFVALITGGLIILLGSVTNPIWITIWILLPLIIALIAANPSDFTGVCNYIGTNGFAEFSFLDSPDNIITNNEISFDNVTDILKGSTVNKRNNRYEGTNYFFLWLNHGKVVYEYEGTHQNKNNEPDKFPFGYFFMSLAINQWTKKLIDKTPEKLNKDGFLLFDLIGFKDDKWFNIPHIKLGFGFIEFIFSNKVVRYNNDEIKKLYFQNGSLVLEHNNYEKKLFGFIKNGDKNEIPLTNLSNQAYFFYAFEKLMGYSL